MKISPINSGHIFYLKRKNFKKYSFGNSIPEDIFQKQEKNTYQLEEERINNVIAQTNKKISDLTEQVNNKEKLFKEVQLKLNNAQAKFDLIFDLEKDLPDDKKSQEYYDAENEVESAKKDLDSVYIYQDFKVVRQLKREKEYLEKLEEYLKQLKLNSNFAFLYNPDISDKEKSEMLNTKGICTDSELALKLGVDKRCIRMWIASGTLNSIKKDRTYFIDTGFKNNSEFLKMINENKDNYATFIDIWSKYNYGQEALISEIKEGKFKLVGLDEENFKDVSPLSVLIDMSDKKTQETLKNHRKLHPVPCPIKYDCVSAVNLQKMGFGKVSQLRQMVQEGILEGHIEKVNTKSGKKLKTVVDISSNDTKNKLLKLRNNNPDVMEIKYLAKYLGMKNYKIKEALLNDEIEIIPEYIPSIQKESTRVFIDLSLPKNKEFVERLMFENEIAREIKEKKRQENKAEQIQRMAVYSKLQSLKMELVWMNCENTKNIAARIAENDGYLRHLLDKENNGEKLNQKEETTIMAYHKKVWEIAGKDEFKNAIKLAQEYLDCYSYGGLDAVEDEKAKELIKSYFDNKNAENK